MPSTPNLAEILAKTGDGLCVLDKDRHVTFVNEKASQLLAAAGTAFHNRVSEAVKEQATIRFDYFHAPLNRWFEHQTYPNPEGGLTVFSRDVTSRHRLEDALRDSEERFRRVIESNIIGVVVVHEDVIIEANDVFLKAVGYTRNDLVTHQIHWRKITSPGFETVDEIARQQLEAEGAFAPYEKDLLHKDGHQILVMVGGVLLRTQPAESLCLVMDLSKRKHAEEENARLYHEAQRANRLKDEFVAIVSHELRTPLTPILGGVYMLRSEPHDENVSARALDLIERNARTLVKIVDDLLDTSRIITGKLKLNMDSVDLSAVVDAAIETVRPASDAKSLNLVVRHTPLSGAVLGDVDRLQQIVWNLLANSVKFTPSGGTVTVEVAQEGADAEIRVIDTGSGIEADFLPHVFERFRQANASRTRVHGGLGLGLAIVRHLTECHGGTVHASSLGANQGSTFIVRLPLQSALSAAES